MNPERTPELFDQWADTYDEIIQAWSDSFPFMGYWQILDRIVQIANPIPSMRILDVGIGTGTLAKKFSDIDCETWGIDYSRRMLELAEEKVPEVRLVRTDVRDDWPKELKRPFDRIVSAYVLHHFDLEEKIRVSSRIVDELLSKQGIFIVGDISFQSQKEFDENRMKLAHAWDDTEYYWIADVFIDGMKEHGYTVKYDQISFCGGIYIITQNADD